MTLSQSNQHIYFRNIEEGERTSLLVLAQTIAAQSSVLDLGCGSGALGQYLAQRKQCSVDGVTYNQDEADIAGAYYRKVAVADLETADLPQILAGQQYDYIVCADVLEHLRAPQRTLHAIRPLLKPEGRLLISIPNTGYAGLAAELLQGEFRYREEGLLDATHLRHFTRQSLLRFLAEARWQVEHLDTIERNVVDSEFRVEFDRLPPAVARHLLAMPDALGYQFIVTARPADEAPDNSRWLAEQHRQAASEALFTAQLYWTAETANEANAAGTAEARKLTAHGVVGRERQTIQFALEGLPGGLTMLRLDPADRPGFLRLYAIRLQSDAGTLWQWNVAEHGIAALGQLEHRNIVWGHAVLGAAGQALAILTSDDPWLRLPVPAEALAALPRSRNARLEVELGWPMSADYLALANVVQPLQVQSHQQTQRALELKERLGALQQQHAQLQQQADAHWQARQRLQQHNDELQKQAFLNGQEREYLFNSRQQLIEHRDHLEKELQGMTAHVHNLINSRPFRYTRPLARLKNTLLGRPTVELLPPGFTPAATPAAENSPVAVPAVPASGTVDIIVPVYRGLADTRTCLESVLQSPLKTPYRLIVINDASPEPEITQWLRETAQTEPRITLLENERNLGFVGTVNRGMRQSTANDVLLLNSDTEVANDWLDRIRAAAYRGGDIASVTPFSTNATICSYPNFCRDNTLPPGQTTASLDALFAEINAGRSVDVPTGVGFCMYIRRASLDDVGFFDEEHFGKGYGEENDFCQRAIGKGWRNLHALDCFVLHTGGVSFGGSKSPREIAAMETLRKLHPRYEADVLAFVQQDPARSARMAVDWAIYTGQGRRIAILAVLHNRAGGTERHVRELAEHLGGQALFLSLKPAADQRVVLEILHNPVSMAPDAPLRDWAVSFRLPDEFGQLVQILRTLPVSHIHYHHLMGHAEAIWNLPQALGVGYDFTVHDFYTRCTNITLTGKSGRYIELDEHLECCDGQHPPPSPAIDPDIYAWRARNRLLLKNARHVLAPSQDAAARIRQFAPEAKARFAPHTDIEPDTALPAPAPRPLREEQPLRVAVIGALSVIKGADVLEDVARLAGKSGAPVEFHLIGYGYRHLLSEPQARLRVHGQYDEKDLPAVLQRLAPDLVWFPAQWPETYSYTLSAALLAGLPVVAPDLGAFAERLYGREWSWVVPWNQPAQEWLDWFLHIRAAHYLPQNPPARLQRPANQAAFDSQPWNYQQDYLQPLLENPYLVQIRQQSRHQPAGGNSHRGVVQYFLQAAPAAPAATAQGLRGTVLQSLARLRSAAALRPIVRAIPRQWQTRVKNWLLKP